MASRVRLDWRSWPTRRETKRIRRYGVNLFNDEHHLFLLTAFLGPSIGSNLELITTFLSDGPPPLPWPVSI